MREKTPQEYANELMKMYRENTQAITELKRPVELPFIASNQIPPTLDDGTGGVQVNVTTIGRLYPVKDALVTVFLGSGNTRTVIETDVTDDSGKSKVFKLSTPPRAESQQSENGGELPYANYNISVKSDGYVEKIAMNVPVFSGVISVQGIDLLPITAAGGHTAPQIIDETNKYNL